MSSNRMKRLLKELNDIRGGNFSQDYQPKKKRHVSASDDDEEFKVSSRQLSDISFPASNIYNSGTGKKPAELFRKDLISAMKMADNEQLDPSEYLVITDHWKPEWERGVQVPVNPDGFPEAKVRFREYEKRKGEFKLPKTYLPSPSVDCYPNDSNYLHSAPQKDDKICRYDLDMLDDQWLKEFNEERATFGLSLIEEEIMEFVIENFEIECYARIQKAIQDEQGLGIEYDEDVICDVCRSPDSEEGNEMVFCDACDICVHQACYGITEIPEGSWMCKTCTLGSDPQCILCPNKGGAMKPVKNGSKWTHVSCALWIPEVSIGCVEKMEPITKINMIPPSRWNLVCSQCKEKNGACIQCNVKSCKTAYHVTCAFKDCLEMKAILVGNKNGADSVKLRSYCAKHSQKKNKKLQSTESDSDEESICNEKRRYSMSEDKTNARNERLQEIEKEFYNYVSVKKIASSLNVDEEVVEFIFQYWKLKRLVNFCKPLLRPKEVEKDILNKQQEDSIYEKMKLIVNVRQYLERVRNLCYMVNRREKLSRSMLKYRAEIFTKQYEILNDETLMLNQKERKSVIHANHTNNVYDILYSSTEDKNKFVNFHSVVSALSHSPRTEKMKRSPKFSEPNPYAKQYTINRTKRHSGHRLDESEKDQTSIDNELLLLPTAKIKVECNSNESSVLSVDVPNLKRCHENEENTLFKDSKKISVIKKGFDKSLDNLKLNEIKCTKSRKKNYPIRLNGSKMESVKRVKLENHLDNSSISPMQSFDVGKSRKLRSKDHLSMREKLREVNAKIRSSVFPNSLSPKSQMLSGYKIPKKCSSDILTHDMKRICRKLS